MWRPASGARSGATDFLKQHRTDAAIYVLSPRIRRFWLRRERKSELSIAEGVIVSGLETGALRFFRECGDRTGVGTTVVGVDGRGSLMRKWGGFVLA